MRYKTSVVLLGAGLVLALVSCRTSGPNPTYAPPLIPPGGGAPLITDDEMAAARTLFVAKCTRCHKFYHPAKYTDEEWVKWFNKMSRKAKLEPDQKELLSRYLEVLRVPSQGRSTLTNL